MRTVLALYPLGNIMKLLDKNTLLSTHYLFRDLERSTLARVASLGSTRRLGDGEVLFLKGDPGDALYGVLSGKVSISTSAPNGKELILSIVEAGGVFGEIALLDGKPRSADATAMDATTLFVLSRADFTRFLSGEPKLAVHFLEMVCDRLRTTNDLIEDAAFLALPARLAKRLLSFCHSSVDLAGGATTEIRISQAEIGQLLATSRETVNRLLQEWREHGWVSLGRGRLTIHDHRALEKIVTTAVDED